MISETENTVDEDFKIAKKNKTKKESKQEYKETK